MAENQNASITIEVNDEGRIKIDTNLSPLGALHLMSNAQRTIIERVVEEDKVETEENPEQ